MTPRERKLLMLNVTHNPNNPEHNPYYQIDMSVTQSAPASGLRGEDMSGDPKWIVKEKNIPCAWYAISPY